MANLDEGAPAGGQNLLIGRVTAALWRSDIMLAIGVIAILVVLILPMPVWLLDISLAGSITLSVLILMTALFIQKPLNFSVFPTILLIATMLRLSLNLASTRLILSNGHEGSGAAGQVIEAFGHFVMGGNFLIGIIVFAILVLVNFVVITKGSGRIAEVSARFSLDAMPGKQMAIYADLSSGLINEDEARGRRKELEEESSFYGSMDGASKFVRGDAIAGLMITFINIVAGIIIGVAQMGMGFGDAAENYTLLTVGDGLVTQIPALIVSTSAGLLVAKAGVVGSADKALFGQLGAYPRAMGVCSVLLAVLAALPGIPMVPFIVLSGATGYAAWRLARNQKEREQGALARTAQESADAPVTEEPISATLQIDSLKLELGYGLLPLIDAQKGHRLAEQIKALRRQIAQEMGFVMPSVRIQDNMQLASNTYVIRVKNIEAGRGDMRPEMLLVMDPKGDKIPLPGEETIEPTFNLPAMWVAETEREDALFRGYTVVDPPTVITTHLTELIKDNMSELLSYGETQKLLDDLDSDHQKLVADLVPQHISMGGIQRVLQSLLGERVSIRDLPTILEGISEAVALTQSIMLITEHVRARLARQISAANCDMEGVMPANCDMEGVMPLIALSPAWETAFAESLIGKGEEKQLSMPPSQLQEFINAVRQSFDRHALMGVTPVLLTSPPIRPYVRSIIERFRPVTVVMSQNEVHPKVKMRTIEQI